MKNWFKAVSYKSAFTLLQGIYDNSYTMASALSYYTLLSIVPILAVAFGIAKGFGFEQALEEQILELFYQQKDFAEKLITFARSTLVQAHGSLIAGTGIVFLFLSAMGLLGNFERALNQIWNVKESRGFSSRITAYLPVLILCPIFIVASSSLTFLMVTKVVDYVVMYGIYDEVRIMIYIFYYALLLLLSWGLFSFLYIYMPNRKVPWIPSLIAALIAATSFQITQWGYIHLQVYLTSYNAIYGSFAAIPLFLLWLQISWLIVLSGAQIAYLNSKAQKPSYAKGSKVHLNLVAPSEDISLGTVEMDPEVFKRLFLRE